MLRGSQAWPIVGQARSHEGKEAWLMVASGPPGVWKLIASGHAGACHSSCGAYEIERCKAFGEHLVALMRSSARNGQKAVRHFRK